MMPWLPVEPGHHQAWHMDGLIQDCIISTALAMEILQSCTKPVIYDQVYSIATENESN